MGHAAWKKKEKKLKKLLRKIDENQSRNLFFVAQHFDEKNNLLNNLRHIKKRKIKNIKQATSVLKKKKKVFVIQQK